MGDQKRWFKVWTSITSDDDFDSLRPGGLLSLGRFTILGAYTALHGERGILEIMPDTLFRLLNITDHVTGLVTIRGDLAFKNVSFEEGKNRHGKITVTWTKWVKYQEDSTQAERQKASRIKRRGEEKRREEIREEEKREDIGISSCAESSGFAPGQQAQNGSPPSPNAPGYSDIFEAFWDLYPKKTGKGAAWKIWRKEKLEALGMDIGGRVFLATEELEQWHKDGGQFIPLPATYLSQRRWEDELPGDRERERKRAAAIAAREKGNVA
jgi:hypothetical protein